jgi:simple sugar transport system ATP-binding protein
MDRSDAPIIELKNVGKNYGNISALRGVSLAVRQGEVTCILGDNGAGKSTLISIIAGLFAHDEGEYLVDGEARKFSLSVPGLGFTSAGVAQLLPRIGDCERPWPVSSTGHQVHAGEDAGRIAPHGHQP